MTGYRVCLDCDHKIPSRGDQMHKVTENGMLIGCEGYHHRETENAVIEVGITPVTVDKVMDQMTRNWMRSCNGEPSEDYADAFSYIGDLLQFIAAEMLYLVYMDDDNKEVVEQAKNKLIEAEKLAEEAVTGLVPFGIDMRS